MTALAAELMLTFDRWTRKQLLLAPGVKAFKNGSAVGQVGGTNAGTVHPAKTAVGEATNLAVGVFNETIDNTANTATSVPIDVNFIREKSVLWRANDGSITAATVFSPCFYVDDQTVSATGTNRAKAGTVLIVDATLGVGFEVEGV